MKFDKLIIHEVDWPHTSFIIISSTEYPELGILAYGDSKEGGAISILLPGFAKTLKIPLVCGCCTPFQDGTGVSWREHEPYEQLRRDFIATLRRCCNENGITMLLFQEFYSSDLGMKQDKDKLHLISPYRTLEGIDFARFKSAFSELEMDTPGLSPEDLAKY